MVIAVPLSLGKRCTLSDEKFSKTLVIYSLLRKIIFFLTPFFCIVSVIPDVIKLFVTL